MKKAICIIVTILTVVSAASVAFAGSYNYGSYSYPPCYSPLGTEQFGEVIVDYGLYGDRKIVRQNANPQARQVDVAYPGRVYPCYAWTTGSNNHVWYYIWIEEDNVWGWVSSKVCTLINYP